MCSMLHLDQNTMMWSTTLKRLDSLDSRTQTKKVGVVFLPVDYTCIMQDLADTFYLLSSVVHTFPLDTQHSSFLQVAGFKD